MDRVKFFSKLVLALLASSGFSVLLVLFRVWFSGKMTMIFLFWNLFLGWLPLLFAVALFMLDGSKKHWLWLGLLFWGWLLFFPNAPYLLTDLIHLKTRPEMPLWYDLLLFFSFAWNGVVLGFTSLIIVHEFLDRRLHSSLSWLAILALLGLNSFGVYLGRFLRWNSWEVITAPLSLLSDVNEIFLPSSPWRTIGFILTYTVFLLFAYVQLRLLFKYQHSLEKAESKKP
jgi:uncharacterized membrane protein